MKVNPFNTSQSREHNDRRYDDFYHSSVLYIGRTGNRENQIDSQAKRFFSGTGAKIYLFIRQIGNEITSPVYSVEQLPQTAADQINFIQAALGITISHLALSLDVERQTIYNWMQSESPPALHARTRERLNAIREYARQWTLRSTRPANKLIATLDLGNGTLLDLLKKPELDQAAIEAGLDVLAKHIETTTRNKKKSPGTSIDPPETSDDRILRRAKSLQFSLPGEE